MIEDGDTRMESMNLLSDTLEKAKDLRTTLSNVPRCTDTELTIIQHNIINMNKKLVQMIEIVEGH